MLKKRKNPMRSTGRMDTRDIGLRLASIFGNHFLQTDHLHYGFWPEELPVKLENLPKAQELYAEYLIGHIPPGVHTILDVGCGTGANALKLLEAGYQVDCVSPSEVFSHQVREKLDQRGTLFQCCFEELVTDRKYDLILFSESFQYIPIAEAFQQAGHRLKPNGWILIADFFRIEAPGTSPMGGGHRLKRFLHYLTQAPIRIAASEDITPRTAPNLQLVDEALQAVAVPSWDLVQEVMLRNYGWVYRPVRFFGNLFFRRKLTKLHYKYLSGERNAAGFEKYKRYMCFLLQTQSGDAGQEKLCGAN